MSLPRLEDSEALLYVNSLALRAKLTTAETALVVLVGYEGYTVGEVAERVRLSVGRVTTLWWCAVSKLRTAAQAEDARLQPLERRCQLYRVAVPCECYSCVRVRETFFSGGLQ